VILTPASLKVARLATLESGELFLFAHHSSTGDTSCVGLVADYRDADPQKLFLLLGPQFPGHITGPHLITSIPATTISFGKNFAIRLPVDPDSWTETEPSHDCNCLLMTDGGVYFRANGNPIPGQGFTSCFVNADGGIVEVIPSLPPGRYARPPGTPAYAVKWEIVTTEPEPRTILRYPYPVSGDAA